MNEKKRRVAFFDVGGTIFRSSLFLQVNERLVAKGIFPESVRNEYADLETKWLNRKGDYETFLMTTVKSFLWHIKGINYSALADVAEEIAEEQHARVYCYTRDLLAELRRKKFYLVAISQSPKTVLQPFCDRIGFDKAYGRIFEIGSTNKFTGNILDEHLIANKANIVRRVVEKQNLTLKGSVAIGDTEGDISMLELVERPIAFNPNQKLYKWAKRNDWEIIVERKDVIYKL